MPQAAQLSQADAKSRETRQAAHDLAVSASLEMGAHRPGDAQRIAELLPAGTKVYVNHLPRHSLEDTLRGCIAARAAGLEPVPHIAARRVATRAELTSFVERAVRDGGVSKVLLLGGDLPRSEGPYTDAAALLREGVLEGSGIREVGVAVYPEGHPRIGTDLLDKAFAEKLALARQHGLGIYAVTQFSFAPNRIVELCARLARSRPEVPVYVGLPGPTNPAKLLKFAQVCGVSASLRALQAQGMGAVRLFTNTDPTDQLVAVAAHVATGSIANVVGVHVFTFGGVDAAAGWINRQIALT